MPLRISVEHLTFWGNHGVSEAERAQKQPFDLDVYVDTSIAIEGVDDRINRTLDYGRFLGIAKRVIETETHQLIETIAYRIACEIREYLHVSCVRVVVRKPHILTHGIPSVTVDL